MFVPPDFTWRYRWPFSLEIRANFGVDKYILNPWSAKATILHLFPLLSKKKYDLKCHLQDHVPTHYRYYGCGSTGDCVDCGTVIGQLQASKRILLGNPFLARPGACRPCMQLYVVSDTSTQPTSNVYVVPGANVV